MRRCLFLLAVALCLPFALRAQFARRGGFRQSAFWVTAQVVDSLSGEPVAFSSVYLQPVGDTLITQFTLSDSKGKAVLDGVTRGEYVFNVEFLGYKPIRRKIYFSESRDLGVVKMQEDATALEAASVSAAVTPMEMRGDTLVYNAAAFQVQENDVLRDLLKKMPGVEVGDDGSVTVQGETVQKITVNGRTFFTGSNSAALDNLPAKAVEKIRVTDHESDRAKVTGIRGAGQSGKSMDVGLKQEYSRGVFGRIGASAGASIPDKGQDPMLGGKPFLWNVNGMLSAFGKQDQVTLLARGQNVDAGENRNTIRANSSGGGGLTTSGQAGVNYTTDRIKGYESAASLYYSGRSRETGSRSTTLNYPASGEEFTSHSLRTGTSGSQGLDLNLSLQSSRAQRGQGWLTFSNKLSFGDTRSSSASQSSSLTGETLRNKSDGLTSSRDRNIGLSGNIFNVFSRMGKEGRNLSLSAVYSLSTGAGDSREQSTSWMSDGDRTVARDLFYDARSRSLSGSLSVDYVEPLAEKWRMQTGLSARYSGSFTQKDATNADGTANDYYSTQSIRDAVTGNAQLLFQYEIAPKRAVHFGASVHADQIDTRSRAQGVMSRLGEGQWTWNWAPFLRYFSETLRVDYAGSSSQPSHSEMLSLLNIADPTRVSTGNIYLKPSFNHRLNFTFHTRRSASMRFASLALMTGLTTHPVVTASWFDASRIRYSLPVMARRPVLQVQPNITFSTPLDKDSRWRMSLYLTTMYSRVTNYQASGTLPGMDTDKFDYMTFIAGFWGSEDGDRFYSGTSGFRESLTHQLVLNPSVNVSYNGKQATAYLDLRTVGRHAWYSLDTQADSHTWVATASLGATWNLPLEFKLSGDYTFNRYFGYSDGFANATHHLNVGLTKNIKAFTLSLRGRDLLNQGLSIVHNIGADSVSDSYSLSLGRHILFGITWNFGRMNARNSRTADRADQQMDGGLVLPAQRLDGPGGFRRGR